MKFERRLAGAFGRDDVWLVGDSAHLTGPAGIQSMNRGLVEGRSLAELFAEVRACRASREDYAELARGWRKEWLRLHGREEKLVARKDATSWAREHAERLVSWLPATGEHLTALADQLGLG